MAAGVNNLNVVYYVIERDVCLGHNCFLIVFFVFILPPSLGSRQEREGLSLHIYAPTHDPAGRRLLATLEAPAKEEKLCTSEKTQNDGFGEWKENERIRVHARRGEMAPEIGPVDAV